MNTKNIYIEFRNFNRFNRLCYVNTEFLRIKREMIKNHYKYHVSFYGAISDGSKILPMRLEIYCIREFTREMINNIKRFVAFIKPIGYVICKYVRGFLIPIITQNKLELIKGV